ncbi:TetR/AcrR family transcriptional regulator [Antarcticimicrobium sediminis]|uniref:TetR/AcrR family transcriptional regulator n=1 Tax=Antarcticimicrobium sediminis TaxID=2546227 RepID=A0A4R5EUE2_9RHOB|nr:TetR/AcrR family transcriptional regulator [Antarcticimicrobium sediminis]TDE38484.1 TetR/AcrR family transcriptional regulator [Antarcticimicrobium sediminis]
MARAAPYDRDAALNAAMTLFWAKGYHATSLKDLESALNMKPGSIYAAFSSKENLYLLALERYFEASRKGLRALLATAPSPLLGLVAHLRSFASLAPDDAARQACMLTKTLVDTRNTDPEIAERTRTYLTKMRDEFAEVFEQAKAAGELPLDADAARLARRYQAAVSALRLELHLGSSADDIAVLAEDMAQEFERLRIPPSDALRHSA